LDLQYYKKATIMKINRIVLILACCFCLTVLHGQRRGIVIQNQDTYKETFEETDGLFHFHGMLGIPIGAFLDNTNTVGIGLGGHYVHRLGSTPFYVGGELDWIFYGQDRSDYDLNIANFTERYRLRVRNNIVLLHGILRLAPDVNGPVRPYFDGMIGTKILYTSTKLENLDNPNADDQRDTQDGNGAFSYGGAVGLQIFFNEGSGAALDVRVAYLPGTEARYRVRREDAPGAVYTDPLDAFEFRSSETFLLMVQVGLSILIN
jgi:hypothetical protein